MYWFLCLLNIKYTEQATKNFLIKVTPSDDCLIPQIWGGPEQLDIFLWGSWSTSGFSNKDLQNTISDSSK